MRTVFAHPALLALALCAAAAGPAARAETLDDAYLQTDGADNVLRIQFVVRVQYLRHVPSESGDLVQVFFQVVGDGERPTTVPEERRVPATESTPAMTVTYPLQPAAPVKKLLVRFARKVSFRVRPGSDNHSIEVVLPAADRGAAVARPPPGAAPVPAPPAVTPRFAIVLDTFTTGDTSRAPTLPPEFADFTLFTAKRERPEGTRYELSLGYFPTAQEAERARRRLRKRFPRASVVALGEPAQPGAAAAAAVPVTPGPGTTTPPSAPAAAKAPTVVPAPAEVEQRAAELLRKGRDALAAGDGTAAIEALNQLLFLPPNASSQEAQELVGLAREKNGETAKARAEYELYLKLYPGTEGAARVSERLAKLKAAPERAAPAATATAARPTIKGVYGSVSQYYYDGSTRTQAAFNTPTGVDRATLSNHDLSSLVTNIDLVGRYRNASADTRLVFRDTNTQSFLSSNPDENRVNAAYVDFRGLRLPVDLKAGRQPGVTGGINGLFDGLIAGYRFAPKWRVNLVGGTPADDYVDSKRWFYGLNVDADMLWDRLSGNAFVIEQTADGVTDRRAVGGELRYFDPVRTLYALVDYDVSYNELNIGMVQGTWQFGTRTTLNVLYDRRKAPLLTTSNALLGQPVSSLDALLQTMSLSAVRAQAEALTADVLQVMVGVSTAVSQKWQLGADFRLTNVGALPAVNGIPATPSTGDIYGYSVQAIGSNLYSKRDLNVFNVTLQTSPTFDGEYFSYSNLTGLGQAWTVEPSIKLYSQRDNLGVTLRRITPGVRITYRLRERVTLESELDYEFSHIESATQEEDTTNRFFYVGYRVDF